MMLNIRPAQMAVLKSEARESFYSKAAQTLHQRQPIEASKLSAEALREYIVTGTEKGEQEELEDDQIVDFLEIGLLPKPFLQRSLIQETVTRVLSNDDVPFANRVAFLKNQVVRRAALEAI